VLAEITLQCEHPHAHCSPAPTGKPVLVGESVDLDADHRLTEPGRQFAVFAAEAIVEVKKVVWPTRKETMQTTAAVFAFVVAMAVFLWMTDKTLEWVLYDLLLGWKKT